MLFLLYNLFLTIQCIRGSKKRSASLRRLESCRETTANGGLLPYRALRLAENWATTVGAYGSSARVGTEYNCPVVDREQLQRRPPQTADSAQRVLLRIIQKKAAEHIPRCAATAFKVCLEGSGMSLVDLLQSCRQSQRAPSSSSVKVGPQTGQVAPRRAAAKWARTEGNVPLRAAAKPAAKEGNVPLRASAKLVAKEGNVPRRASAKWAAKEGDVLLRAAAKSAAEEGDVYSK